MTPRQIELARHALGLPNARKQSYRNRFIAGEGHSDQADWDAMVLSGDAKVVRKVPLYRGDDAFWLTPQGATAALRAGERLSSDDFPVGQP
jgi:hypothetical protein